MNECIICYNQLDNDDIKQECGHSFHTLCLYKWILESDTCPICRSTLINKNKFKIDISTFMNMMSIYLFHKMQ
jgi:hypothetical protein